MLEQNFQGEYIPIYDGNGNIIAYKNSVGKTVATYSYDPFGNTIAHWGMDFSYKFSTKPQDDLIGLYYYGYRYYRSLLGRFINRDPIEEEGGVNLYNFIDNDIVNYYDNLGLERKFTPDSQYCQSLRRRMDNILKEIKNDKKILMIIRKAYLRVVLEMM